ncbi:MAG TPA: hypothetical protein VES93_12635 [Ornithinibacter sp.]|nr:hypothetical protein [Ornithinibacter sp.]
MTPRPLTTPRFLSRLVASTTLLGALVLAGCGTQDALVGLHPAPAEQTASAPLDTEGATAVAARLLAAAGAPAQGDAKAAAAARAQVLTGDALRVANADAARATPQPEGTELAPEPTPTVVAQSQGRQWPRAILATTLDEPTNTQWLHVMVSDEPDQPFKIASSVPMFPGTTLPALGEQLAGAPLLETTAENGLPLSPAAAVTAYAGALAHPKPKASTAVAVDDPFAERLKAAAAVQSKALGKLATLTQAHTPVPDDAITFRLADGGAVTFALLGRTDTISVRPRAKELVLPAEYAKLVGKKKVTRSLTLANLEPIVMIVPKTGRAEVIGARDLLTSGKAR